MFEQRAELCSGTLQLAGEASGHHVAVRWQEQVSRSIAESHKKEPTRTCCQSPGHQHARGQYMQSHREAKTLGLLVSLPLCRLVKGMCFLLRGGVGYGTGY